MALPNNNKITISTGFTGLLAIAFIVLKLTNVITWSWWWVLAPLWIPLAIVLIIVGIIIYANITK